MMNTDKEIIHNSLILWSHVLGEYLERIGVDIAPVKHLINPERGYIDAPRELKHNVRARFDGLICDADYEVKFPNSFYQEDMAELHNNLVTYCYMARAAWSEFQAVMPGLSDFEDVEAPFCDDNGVVEKGSQPVFQYKLKNPMDTTLFLTVRIGTYKLII